MDLEPCGLTGEVTKHRPGPSTVNNFELRASSATPPFGILHCWEQPRPVITHNGLCEFRRIHNTTSCAALGPFVQQQCVPIIPNPFSLKEFLSVTHLTP